MLFQTQGDLIVALGVAAAILLTLAIAGGVIAALKAFQVKQFQHMLTNHGSHDKVLVSVTSMPIVNSAGEVTGTSAALVELETQAGQGIDDLTGLWRGQWFAAATVPFWGVDANGQILDVNAAAL